MRELEPAFLPYGRQSISDEDISAVVDALKADILTTGPRVDAFETAFAEAVEAKHAVVCANGTAALHLAAIAAGVEPGDVCIVPAVTFVATANCARFMGADVVFADVDPNTGLLTPDTLREAIARCEGRQVKAILPVHLSGWVVDMAAVAAIAREIGAVVIEDACHALGSRVGSDKVGGCAHSAMSVFSFHPVKTIASGEGGMVTTNDAELATKLKRARAHGITRDPEEFQDSDAAFDGNVTNPWYYEQADLGFNYRLPDILCALGHSQLNRLGEFSERRAALASLYRERMAALAPAVKVVKGEEGVDPTLHLLVALIDFPSIGRSRRNVIERLRSRGVGTQVHYIPVPDQPYYRNLYGEQALPGARAYYDRCLSLPLFPAMQDEDVDRVVEALKWAIEG